MTGLRNTRPEKATNSSNACRPEELDAGERAGAACISSRSPERADLPQLRAEQVKADILTRICRGEVCPSSSAHELAELGLRLSRPRPGRKDRRRMAHQRHQDWTRHQRAHRDDMIGCFSHSNRPPQKNRRTGSPSSSST